MRKTIYAIITTLVLALTLPVGCMDGGGAPPNLVGVWHGMNHTVSQLKGYQEWQKTVHVTEQQDRRFRGYFDYAEGRIDFFGVVFPDDSSFAWVSAASKGYNLGRILGRDKLSACYVEAGDQATAGCVELTREKS